MESQRAPEPLTLTWGEAAAAMDGRLVTGDPQRPVEGISIDTRTLAKGDLYVAIQGERLNGHDFVDEARARGAAGVVVSDVSAAPPPGVGDGLVVVVGNTTHALQSLARHVRRQSGTKVVAITGSAGKTTTKEVTGALLETRYRVFRNVGNLNNHIGLPLSLLQLRARPEVAVVELGMNHAGEISTLVGIAEPDVRVWTNVAPVHAAFFASVDAIADAKAEIFEGAHAGSLLITNADDARIMARTPAFAGRTVTFGIDRDADLRASAVEDRGLTGMQAQVTTPAGDANVSTPLLGRGNLANVLAGMAVALAFDVPLPSIVDRVARLRPATRRGEVRELSRGVLVVDDTYNSNPVALQRVLDVLRRDPRRGRRVAVLGEMRELGVSARALHEECGRAAVEAGVSLLLTVGGEDAEALGAAAIEAGLPRETVRHFAASVDAADVIASLIEPGDLVLVKGSRGTRTDVVVDRLVEALS